MLPPDALNLASRHLQAGRPDDAEALARAVIAERPGSAEAFHLLGRVATARGRHDSAVESFRRAVSLDDRRPAWWFDLGNAWKSAQKPESAVEAYQKALRLQESPDYRYNLGNAFKALGRLEEAAREYRRCVAARPDFAEANTNLGNTLRALGRADEAMAAWKLALLAKPALGPALAALTNHLAENGRIGEAEPALRRAIAARADSVDAWFNLGRLLRETGRPEEAVAAFERAITLRPGDGESWLGLGNAKKALHRVDEAMAAWRRASEPRPHAGALYNLGKALNDAGRTDEAIEAYRSAVAVAPKRADAWNNLGTALRERGRREEAEAALRRAVEIEPKLVEAWHNLGNLLRFSNRIEQAVEAWQQALALRPDHTEALCGLLQARQSLCDWSGLDRLVADVLSAIDRDAGPVLPLVASNLPVTAAQLGACSRQWAARQWRPAQPLPPVAPGPRERLRIGYLSGDLCEHAVGYLTAGLFERHDRAKVSVNAYSFGPDDGGPTRARIAAGCDVFRDVRALSFGEIARTIREDGVDILVDLNGWTGTPRPGVLALRPAPVQVAWLGWPGPMGAPDLVDYTLADAVVAPPEEEGTYGERVWRLPGAYQVNDDRRVVAEIVPTRAELGLPDEGFVFACFNGPQKISASSFDGWMRILKKVPGSVLWLLAPSATVSANLAREAAARGVAPERLVFAKPLPVAAHVARQARADLFLDTLPYNAHTTASDALWVGLPVLTQTGSTFAGRVATSLVRAAGVPELAVKTAKAYEAEAVRLAKDPAAVRALRERLLATRASSALFDTAAFARKLEAAYAEMWPKQQLPLFAAR